MTISRWQDSHSQGLTTDENNIESVKARLTLMSTEEMAEHIVQLVKTKDIEAENKVMEAIKNIRHKDSMREFAAFILVIGGILSTLGALFFGLAYPSILADNRREKFTQGCVRGDLSTCLQGIVQSQRESNAEESENYINIYKNFSGKTIPVSTFDGLK